MSNSTRELTPAFYAYVSYAAMGMIIVPANLLVAFSILRYIALRRKKEYIVLMGLFFADAINMTAYISGGIYRIYKFFTHPVGQMVTSRYCLGAPHILLWTFSDINAQLMLVVISVDRLLSVAFPLQYIKLTHVYAQRMVIGAYSFCLLSGALGFYFSYTRPQIPEFYAECFGASVIKSNTKWGRIYEQYYNYMPQSCALTSIFIFALVPLVYTYRKKNLVHDNSSENEKRRLAQQRKVTISMAISCACTLFIYNIPYRLAFDMWDMGMYGVAYGMWAFTNNNSMANVIIYELRHNELRVALKSMLACKELPAALNLWRAVTTNRVAPTGKSGAATTQAQRHK